MKRLVLVLVLASCEKAAPPAADPLIDGLIGDLTAYGEKSVPMLAAFDGDCGAFADKMLALEPLAQAVRARQDQLEKDPARLAAARDRVKAETPAMKAHYEPLLKPMGMTIADIDRKEVELKTKCSDDPKYRDAEQRTGLRTRKH
jgi:hypothetical protein